VAIARAVVLGYGDIGVRGLATLLEAGLEVPLVVTHVDDPNETRWYASLFDFSRSRKLHVLADPPADAVEKAVADIRPDLIFSFYYRSMLPMPLLRHARLGAFNLHGSLLPKFRGRAPLNWAIAKGERETGVTLHEMVEKPDAGRIVDQETVPIGPDDTAVEVFHRMTKAAEIVLKRSLPAIVKGAVQFKPNDLARGSYFGRRRPEDGRIDWSRSAQEIHNLVRAVAPPFPGAFDDRLKVHRTQITDRSAGNCPPGTFQEQGEWFAVCGDGKVLRLLEVQERK
jgi:methionyl-tRNA formyltransferase